MADTSGTLLKEQLARYRSHILKDNPGGAEKIKSAEDTHGPATAPAVTVTDATPSPIVTVEHRFALSHRHGRYRFYELYDVLNDWESLSIDHPLKPKQVTARDLVFFDTETTGLYHGAGNLVFLLGYARFEGSEVVVTQHFLSSPAAEAPLYQAFFSRVDDAKYWLTYNGKSFDWPQVRSRHTLLRGSVPALPAFEHIDLLYPTRRLWADQLPSCRLATVEQQQLEVVREGDIPGQMAPILYFDYLRKRDMDVIWGVLTHNEWDVLSLISLYIHLSWKILRYRDSAMASDRECFAISRWYEQLGHDGLAQRGYEKIALRSGPFRQSARLAMGRLLKRQGDWQGCLERWEEGLSEQIFPSEELLLDLSKIYEHHLQDYRRALDYAEQARTVWIGKQRSLRRHPVAADSPHERRLERLRNKLAGGSVEIR